MSTNTTPFDLEALRAAIETDDPERTTAIYAPDAVVETFNRDHGPADPVTLSGRDALRKLFNDVASRHLTHRVDRAVVGDGTGATQVTCTYPDGLKVLCISTFDHDAGLITRETRMEVWDA
jgi:hypothetical protein